MKNSFRFKIELCPIKLKKIKIKNSLFSYHAQPKVAVHCSYGAKKYNFGFFGSTIVRHILVFGGAKNSNIAI